MPSSLCVTRPLRPKSRIVLMAIAKAVRPWARAQQMHEAAAGDAAAHQLYTPG